MPPPLSYESWRDCSAATTSARPTGSPPGGVRPWPEQEEADAAAFRHSVERLQIPFRASPEERANLLAAYLRQVNVESYEEQDELFHIDRNLACRRRLKAEHAKRWQSAT